MVGARVNGAVGRHGVLGVSEGYTRWRIPLNTVQHQMAFVSRSIFSLPSSQYGMTCCQNGKDFMSSHPHSRFTLTFQSLQLLATRHSHLEYQPSNFHVHLPRHHIHRFASSSSNPIRLVYRHSHLSKLVISLTSASVSGQYPNTKKLLVQTRLSSRNQDQASITISQTGTIVTYLSHLMFPYTNISTSLLSYAYYFPFLPVCPKHV